MLMIAPTRPKPGRAAHLRNGAGYVVDVEQGDALELVRVGPAEVGQPAVVGVEDGA